MKVKTIILILVGLILVALIGANIYDFYKDDAFVVRDNPQEELTYEAFSDRSLFGDTLNNFKFLTDYKYESSMESVVITYVFKDNVLVDSVVNKITKSRTIDCRAYNTEKDGVNLIYLTAINQDERNLGKYSVYMIKEEKNKWLAKKLTESEINKDSVLTENVKKIAILR
ncbi:MAG: hypothetical protein ABL872_06755 [Lacibacter sp.]